MPTKNYNPIFEGFYRAGEDDKYKQVVRVNVQILLSNWLMWKKKGTPWASICLHCSNGTGRKRLFDQKYRCSVLNSIYHILTENYYI